MKPTRTRLVGVAAALAAIAIAAPAAAASAHTTARASVPGALVAVGWGGSPALAIPVTGAVAGQAAAVTGAAIITTAPTTFINTNNQVAAADNLSGGQFGP